MKTELTIKYLLSFFLIMVGINKFISFMPPMGLSQDASNFMGSLMETGYLLPTVALIEILCGFLLFKRNTTPIGLVLLAPISVNIILFHLFLDPMTIWMALFVATSNTYLIYKNRDFYSPMLLAITNGKTITRQTLKKSHFSYS